MILDYNIMDDEDMGTDGAMTPAGDDEDEDDDVEGDDMDTTSEESAEETM